MRTTLRILLFTVILIFIAVYSAFATTYTYYSRQTGSWASSSTWSTSACGSTTNTGTWPVAGDIVNICDGHTITINASAACATLNIGGGASGVLQFGTGGTYTLTVSGNITVNAGATFQSHQSSTSFGKQHTINLTGSLTNNGTVKLGYDNNDYTQLVFQGSGTSTVSGSGTWSSMAYMTLNKSTKTDVVHITSTGFGSALTTGADALTTPQSQHKNPPVVFTTGTFWYDISDNLSNLVDAGASGHPTFTIPSNVVIRVDQGTVDLGTYSGIGSDTDVHLMGDLIVNGGTVTVSKNTNTSGDAGLMYEATPTPNLTINGGTVNCWGPFTTWNVVSDVINFTMTGGTFNINMGPTATYFSNFWVTGDAGSTFNWSGGTVVIQNKSTYTSSSTKADFSLGNACAGCNISGTATVQFGNSSTPSTQTMRFSAAPAVTFPNVVVYNPGGGKVVTLAPYNNADFTFMSLNINSGQAFDNRDINTSTDNHTMTLSGDWTNNGTFTARTGTVIFNGSTNSNITGATTTPFYNLTINKFSSSYYAYFNTAALRATNNVSVTAGTLQLGYTGGWSDIDANLSVSSSAYFNHTVEWNTYGVGLFVGGNMAIDGSYTYGSRATIEMDANGVGGATKNVHATGTSILLLTNGNFYCDGNLTINDNLWAMFGSTGSFHTNGNTATANQSVYINGGTVYVDGGNLNAGSTGINVGYATITGALNISSGTATCGSFNVGDGTRLGTVTHSGGTCDVNGDLTINSSCSYTCSSSPLINVSGNWINNGTFTAASSTATFDGSTNSTISGGATTFCNLTLNKNSASNNITLSVGTNITGTYTMTTGYVNLNAKILTLGTAAASPGTLSYTSGMMIRGTFNRWFGTAAIANGSVTGLFPMGDTTLIYRPFYVSYPAGISTGGSISISHTTINGGTNVSYADGTYTIQTRHKAYWTSTYAGFAGVSGTPFNIQAGASGMGEVTNINDLRITRLNDVVGTAGTNSGTNSVPIVQRINLGLTNISNNFYIGTVNPATSPLPIELLSFEARPQNNMVQLSWVTASESNNDYFTVERSSDGKDFEEVIRVKGAGNSNQMLYYSALDTDPYQGVSYYRLNQTDFDNNIKYSDIVQVVMTVEINLTVFPNPLEGTTLYVQFAEEVKNQEVSINIYDINGKSVYSSQKTVDENLEENTIKLDLKEKLAGGIYIIRITAGQMKKMCQLVIR